MTFRIQCALACLALALGLGCAPSEVPESVRPAPQRAAAVPEFFDDSQVVDDLGDATSMAFAPDGRLFVCEQAGRLRVVRDGVLLPEPFLTVDTDDSGERGLLGVAIDPDFPSRPYVYVFYTALSPVVHNRVSRFTADGDRAVPGSEQVLMEFDELGNAYHNGGALHFGKDGKLYIAVGDNTRASTAQTLFNRLGKVLRIDKDGTIPSDNPFYATASEERRAIWALGLRNPFSLAVQPGTGRILVNDVGTSRWEEVNEGLPGANYGWPETQGPTDDARFQGPLFAYPHDGPDNESGCAISAGTFYNPSRPQFPARYEGLYFFADYCNGWIRTLHPDTGAVELFATGLRAPVDLDVGPDGGLYYLDRRDDSVRRIQYLSGQPPVILDAPESVHVAAGQPARFSVNASGTPPLAFQWLRDGVALPGEDSDTLTLPSVARGDSGARFSVRVDSAHGSALSSEAHLTVDANTAPVARILLPLEGARYRAGQALTFQAEGHDAEDGVLPASALRWRVDFHHASHFHPFLPDTQGSAGATFTLPDTGESSADVWYRIHLEVRDSRGARHAVYRDVRPSLARLRLETAPPGLEVRLDGEPQRTPSEVDSVVGLRRTLGVVTPQVLGGVTYVFEGWAHGGEASHTLPTPEADTLYTARFRAGPPAAPGTGLAAEYFDGVDFNTPRLTRVDAQVDFRWRDGPPAPELDDNDFSVRWTGSLVAPTSETYTLYTQSNDGVRLWVDGQLLIDHWTVHTQTEDSATLALEAGRAYSLRMEFFENRGWATARLLWSSPSLSKQLIPEAALRPVPPSP